MDIFVIVLLVMTGLLLLAVEVAFVPGLGFPGVLGVLFMSAAVVYAFAVGCTVGWCTLAASISAIVALILWAIYGRSIDRLALKKNIDSKAGNTDASALQSGDEGVATTRLALVGEVDFGGRLVEVCSADGLLEAGCRVSVSRIEGGMIYVKSVAISKGDDLTPKK